MQLYLLKGKGKICFCVIPRFPWAKTKRCQTCPLISLVSSPGHVQRDNSSDDGNDADDLEDADRLSKKENSNGCYQGGADTAPDGVRNADIDPLECQCQKIKTDAVEQPHQHGGRGFGEPHREFHADRACHFGENSECEIKPVHIVVLPNRVIEPAPCSAV